MSFTTSKEIAVSIRRVGAMGFDINIYVEQNPALQDEAMQALDAILSKPNDCISSMFPWSVGYNVGASYRHICGEPKPTEALLNAWIKTCSQKYGKNFRVEK